MSCCCGDYYGFSIGTREETLVNVARFDVLSNPSTAPDALWRKFHPAATGYLDSGTIEVNDDAYCCRVLSDDSIVTGAAYSSAQDPTFGSDVLLSKWSNGGSLLATYKTYNGTQHEGCGQIERDDDDNIYCVLASYNSNVPTGSLLVSLDADLNVRWAKSYSDLGATALRSIATDGAGITYVAPKRPLNSSPTGYVLSSGGSISQTFATPNSGGPFDTYYFNGSHYFSVGLGSATGFYSFAVDDNYLYTIATADKQNIFGGSQPTIAQVWAAYKFDRSTGAIAGFSEDPLSLSSLTRMRRPWNIELDASGNWHFISNRGTSTGAWQIRTLSADMTTWTTTTFTSPTLQVGGRTPFLVDEFGTRRVLAVRPDGSKYTVGFGTNLISKWTATNTLVWGGLFKPPPALKSSSTSSGGTTSLDFDSSGQLIATDKGV